MTKKKIKLIPPNKEHCQVLTYQPMMLGGGQNLQPCNKKPSWIVYETKPSPVDGQMGSQSCCVDCREKYKNKLMRGYRWEKI